MNTFLRFFYEFISIFFEGIMAIFRGFVKGLSQIVNYNDYNKVINSYKDSFKGAEWLLVGIAIAILVIIVGLIGLLIFFAIRRLLRFRKYKLNQEDLLDEIAGLNEQVRDLIKEKNEIMAMKVSQLGLKPDEKNTIEETEEQKEEGEAGEENVDDSKSIPKLKQD